LLTRALGFVRRLLADRDLRVLLLANVLVGVAYSFVIPFMSLFGTREIGLGPVPFSLFLTANSLGAIALSTVLARWSDARWSRRSVLLVGSVAGCFGYLGYAFVRDVAWLSFLGVVVLGLASVTFSQLFALARDLFNRRGIAPSEIPLYMNVFRLFFALSWTVGPAIAAWLMQWAGFRGLFLVASAFFGLLALLVVAFVPHVPPAPAAAHAARSSSWFGQALRVPGLLAHFAAFVVFFACSSMGMMNLPLLLLGPLRGSEHDVGIAYSVAPFFELPLMLLAGVLAGRWPARRLIQGVFLLGIVYYALLASVRAPWQVYPVQVLSAAIVAVTSGIAITFFQDFLPDQPGSATNLYSNAQRIGSTSGYLLLGWLTEATGTRGVFAVCALGAAIAAGILLAHGARRKLAADPAATGPG
jgi:SET family sugar efflux transporter-like MFS transporter